MCYLLLIRESTLDYPGADYRIKQETKLTNFIFILKVRHIPILLLFEQSMQKENMYIQYAIISYTYINKKTNFPIEKLTNKLNVL